MAKEKVIDKSLLATIERLNKDYGKGCVMMMNEKMNGEYDIVSTGSIGFDKALGIGGYVSGKTYELMGWEGTGKTTICGHACEGFQRKYPNRKVLYVDAEHALDMPYFKKLGVDTNKMLLSQPNYGEEGFNIAEQLIKTGDISLCIIDSDTMMKPQGEMEGEVGDSSIGKKARLNSQAYPKLHLAAELNNTCVIIISQFREKIGVMFGSPVTTSGGNALRFIADCRIEVSKTIAKDGDDVYGNRTKIKITKSKMAPPFKKAEFDIIFGEGIDRIGEIIEMSSELDIIEKSGSWFSYNENKIGQGINSVKEMLKDNPELAEEIKQKLLNKLKNQEIDDTRIE